MSLISICLFDVLGLELWMSPVPFSMLLSKITFILCVYIITLSLQQFNSSSYLCIVGYWQVSEVKHCMSISTFRLVSV